MKLRRACENCPWRVDAPREHWDPSHFESIYQNCQDDGIHMMLCHKSAKVADEQTIVCQGWVRVMGFEAVGVRIAALQGLVTEEEISDTDGPELFESFDEMMKANRIRQVKRNRWTSR